MVWIPGSQARPDLIWLYNLSRGVRPAPSSAQLLAHEDDVRGDRTEGTGSGARAERRLPRAQIAGKFGLTQPHEITGFTHRNEAKFDPDFAHFNFNFCSNHTHITSRLTLIFAQIQLHLTNHRITLVHTLPSTTIATSTFTTTTATNIHNQFNYNLQYEHSYNNIR